MSGTTQSLLTEVETFDPSRNSPTGERDMSGGNVESKRVADKKIRINDHDRIRQLDGIRGLAIVLVLLHHLAVGRVWNIPWFDSLCTAISSGWFGVDIFFVLSGFLITGNLLERKGKPHYFRNFIVRRGLRVMPLYFGYLIFVAVGTLLMVHVSPFKNLGWTPWVFGTNIAMGITQHWNVGTAPLGHFWSLAVEEHFYLLWPLLIMLARTRRVVQICSVGILGILIARTAFALATGNIIAAGVFTPFKIDSMMLGALAAIFVRSNLYTEKSVGFLKPAAFLSGIASLAVLLAGAYNRESIWSCTIGFTVLSAFFAVVILLSLTSPTLKRFFSNRLLCAFGIYSYGIYVFHPLIYVWMQNRAVTHTLMQIVHNQMGAFVLNRLLVVALSFGLAALSFHLYEKPLLSLKRYV